MIIQLDIFNFKALRAVRVPLQEYQLLVGPNGSGKSSVFDAVLFLRNALAGEGPEQALRRTGAESLVELTHQARGGTLAYSLAFSRDGWPILRYTVLLSQNAERGLEVEAEAVTRQATEGSIDVPDTPQGRAINFDLFRDVEMDRQIDCLRRHASGKTTGWERILYKSSTDTDVFVRVGTRQTEKVPYQLPIKIGRRKQLGLKFVPDESGFEYANWIKDCLLVAPLRVQLDIEAVKLSGSPERSGESLSESGDNFANVVFRFHQESPDVFLQWLAHVREYFPEVASIDPQVMPENRRRLTWIVTESGTRIPQYLLSDGTLRFLALTLLAFQRTSPRLILVEEPENGLHPSAVEGVLAPFKTVDPEQQVIFASHSPIVLSNFKLHDVLVFRKGEEGTELVKGDHHPVLTDWVGDVDEASLLAAGIF